MDGWNICSVIDVIWCGFPTSLVSHQLLLVHYAVLKAKYQGRILRLGLLALTKSSGALSLIFSVLNESFSVPAELWVSVLLLISLWRAYLWDCEAKVDTTIQSCLEFCFKINFVSFAQGYWCLIITIYSLQYEKCNCYFCVSKCTVLRIWLV